MMLKELHNIRRLLTVPDSENIRIANAELENLTPSLHRLSQAWREQPESGSFVLQSIAELKAELSAICSLSQAASDYFRCLRLVRASGFGAYERDGAVRSLDESSRTLAQL